LSRFSEGDVRHFRVHDSDARLIEWPLTGRDGPEVPFARASEQIAVSVESTALSCDQRWVESWMKHGLACIFAIAGWYLLYPPATHTGNPDSYAALSQWNIDGSYGTSADCHEAHHDDLNASSGTGAELPRFPTNPSRPMYRVRRSPSLKVIGKLEPAKRLARNGFGTGGQ
jgi:hypothetical protein